MKIKFSSRISGLSNYNCFLISALIFGGYYVLLALFITWGSESFTRAITIPVRIIISVLAIAHLFFFWVRKKTYSLPALAFYFFSLLYISRIFWEILNNNGGYHQSLNDFFLYYISFAVIPFVYYLQIKSDEGYKSVFYGIFYSCLLFAITSYFLYGFVLGSEFGRISQVENLNTVSPLSLSYCSAILLGLASYNTFFVNKKKFKERFIYVFSIAVGIIPFFLGSSRGSILALLFSMLTAVMGNSKGFKTTLKYFFLIILGFILLFALSDNIGSSIFDRLFNIGRDISLNTSSVKRLDMWEKSLQQFAKNPFLGNSMESSFINFHPHNIMIESMITTGIMGFFTLLGLIGGAFYKSIMILRRRPELGWISIIFVQATTQHMFSGGLYAAVWLWSIIGLVYSVNTK